MTDKWRINRDYFNSTYLYRPRESFLETGFLVYNLSALSKEDDDKINKLWFYQNELKPMKIPSNPEYNGNTALHTVAMYMTGFKGTVYLQATLNNNPADTGYYSTIQTLTYNGFTGIDYANFNGVYTYINILVVPELGPTDLNNRDNQSYRGTFDKILYRS
jgi:hypothetical protein